MLPSKGTLKKNHKTTPIKGISTLKTSIVLGANASGKSNLIKAIAFGRWLLLKGVPTDQPIDYPKFRLNKEAAEKSTRMEYEIQAGGKNYAFGFILNNRRVEEEWLYEITSKSQKLIYDRDLARKELFNIDPLLHKNPSEEEKLFLKFIAKGTPDNQLFLREVISRKVKENVTDIADLTAV
ncbi:MAG: AAA family ATPase, partial [Phocaeicola sp.]